MGAIVRNFAIAVAFVLAMVGVAVIGSDIQASMAIGWIVLGVCIATVKLVVQTLLHYRAGPARQAS